MKPGSALTLALGFAIVVALPVPIAAGSDPENYLLRMNAPNRGVAPNGDIVHVTCNTGGGACGTFSVNPKAVVAMGEFLHTDSAGNVLGGGTWTATQLISFQSYGCGVVTFPDPDVILPPNFCGGKVRFRVVLNTPVGQLDGILTVFCIVGPKAPGSHDEPIGEGVTLDIPGFINFNHTTGGMNIYIRM
jgi:hypothetical protein